MISFQWIKMIASKLPQFLDFQFSEKFGNLEMEIQKIGILLEF